MTTMPTTTTQAAPAVPTAEARPTTIREWLKSDQYKAELAAAVPRHLSPDRQARIALTAINKTPLLAECTPGSLLTCLLSMTQWGLEPDGRHAHLIPFKNNKKGTYECQLILDYKGLVQLLFNTGKVMSCHADVVHEGDIFTYSMGQIQEHVLWFLRTDKDKPEKKGEVIAAYARVVLAGGSVKCEVMDKADIDKIRSGSRAGRSGPWVSYYNEMAKKTVFRRATKWLPVSSEVVEALERDFDTPDFAADGTVVESGGLESLRLKLDGPEDNPMDDAPPEEPDDNPLHEPGDGPPTSAELRESEGQPAPGELFEYGENEGIGQ